MCHRALKQEQILSCALRDCDFNCWFVFEEMRYETLLWRVQCSHLVGITGGKSKVESKEACNIPSFYLVKCVIAVNLAEMSSEGGAVVPATVVLISVVVQDLVSLFCVS